MSRESEVRRWRVKFPDRGVELELVDWGGGPRPLALLAHATGFCAACFDPLAARLRERFRVIGWDARGHGGSEKPPPPGPYGWGEFALDVSAVTAHVLGELGLDRVSLAVGHSFGGTCTLDAAVRDPERYDRLALLDPVIVPAPPDFPGADPMRGGPNVAASIARKRRHIFASRDEIRERWREKGTFADWDPRALDGYLAFGFRDRADGRVELACPGEIEAAVFESGARFDAWKSAEKLARPALLLHAARGNFPAALAQRFASKSPSFQLVPFDAPHLLAMTSPDAIADALFAFAPA